MKHTFYEICRISRAWITTSISIIQNCLLEQLKFGIQSVALRGVLNPWPLYWCWMLLYHWTTSSQTPSINSWQLTSAISIVNFNSLKTWTKLLKFVDDIFKWFSLSRNVWFDLFSLKCCGRGCNPWQVHIMDSRYIVKYNIKLNTRQKGWKLKICSDYEFTKHIEAEWRIYTCVSKFSILGSDNGLSPGRRQAII